MGTHLLTVPFLRDCCGAVLKPGGTLTICTDNIECGRWLLHAVAAPELANIFDDALHGTKACKVGRLESVDNRVDLRTRSPPMAICGADYDDESSASYFQRLKTSEKGSKGVENGADRYFLCLRRR